jgi:hypothetical protein
MMLRSVGASRLFIGAIFVLATALPDARAFSPSDFLVIFGQG